MTRISYLLAQSHLQNEFWCSDFVVWWGVFCCFCLVYCFIVGGFFNWGKVGLFICFLGACGVFLWVDVLEVFFVCFVALFSLVTQSVHFL